MTQPDHSKDAVKISETRRKINEKVTYFIKSTDDYQTSYRSSLVTLLRSRNSSWMVVTSDVLLSGPHLGGWAWPVLKFTSENGTFDGDLKHGRSRFPRSLYKTTLCNNYQKTSAFLHSSGVLYAHSFPCLSRSFCHFYHDQVFNYLCKQRTPITCKSC